MRKSLSVIFIVTALLPGVLLAQDDNLHRQSTENEWPEGPTVLKKLDYPAFAFEFNPAKP